MFEKNDASPTGLDLRKVEALITLNNCCTTEQLTSLANKVRREYSACKKLFTNQENGTQNRRSI